MIHDVFSQYLDLISHPGKTLHVEWWDIFGMKRVHESYYHKDSDRALRHVIDRELRAKRSDLLCHNIEFKYLPDERESFLISSMHDLEKLITYAGLVMMKCPDYLYLKEYRTPLSMKFTSGQLNQLHVFWLGGSNQPKFDCNSFLNAAFSTGISAINVELQESHLWPLIALTLPVPKFAVALNKGTVFNKIIRMARFL